MALLRGVEIARTKYDSLKVALEIRYLSPPPATTVQCIVELDGSRRRFEVLAGDVPAQVIIRDGDVFHEFRRKQHADVELYDMEEATGARGTLNFDPRILGLYDLMSARNTVKACMFSNDLDSLEVVGKENLHDVRLWRVRAVRNGTTIDTWIEEPSFRVHRRTLQRSSGVRIEINSQFDSSAPGSPFPSRVEGKRTYPDRFNRDPMHSVCIAGKFEAPVDIPAERFTMKSMDLPLVTPVVDYRISRIIGYWNGEGLSENPTEARRGGAGPPSAEPQPQGHGRLILIAVNLAVLALIGILWWRKRAAARRG